MNRSLNNLPLPVKIIMGAVGLFIIAWLLSKMSAISRSMMPDENERNRAVSGTAVITDIAQNRKRGSQIYRSNPRAGSSATVHVEYDYDGNTYTGTVPYYGSMNVGDTLEIKIDPENPSKMWLAKAPRSSAAPFAGMAVAVLVCAGVMFAAKKFKER